jgi:hypothetical protein
VPTLRQILYSFPIRLLVLHVRNHFILLLLWILLAAFSTGLIGRYFGLHYLLLTPEYMGEVNFMSFFLSGAAFGGLVMVWNLTTYLLCAGRFPFLATLEAPFTKFSINNAPVPLAFFAVWLVADIWFQWHDEFTKTIDIVIHIGGFIGGVITLILLMALYFYFTNKDIVTFLRPLQFVPRPGGRLLVPGQRLPTMGEIQSGLTRWRVDTYLNERLRPRLVRSVAHYHPHVLEQVFRQNHWNAVVVQVAALLGLMTLGLLMDNPWARIPYAASIFIFVSMGMALFGAITFWFGNWSTFVFITLLVVVNFVTGHGWFNYRNRAYGLNYEKECRFPYDYAHLETLCHPDTVRKDKAATLRILNNWLERNQTPENPKPKLVFICVSGGGLRSALWVMRTLQEGDRAVKGKLLRRSILMTGASGGMLGAAYVRELYWQRQKGNIADEHDPVYMQDMGKDLLNSIAFATISTDFYYPMATFQFGNHQYRKDKGYLFERQLNENCRFLLQRRLSEYRKPEMQARIPMLLLSPYILNDARRLIISPQPVSYLMQPGLGGRLTGQTEIDGVDFSRMFAGQDADSFAFSTGLRMNCTYPLVLPNVWMPTRPSIEVMDAGLRDNYGSGLAVRFVQTFRDWIQEHTGGVVFVQMRSWEKINDISPSDRKGVVNNLLTPAGSVNNVVIMQDYEQDQMLTMLSDILGKNRVEIVRFTYRPVRKQREASLSFHLSKREKMDISEAFQLPENQAALRALKQVLK